VLGALLAFSRGADWFSEWTGKIAQWVVLPTVAVGVISVILRYGGRLMGQRLTSNAVIEMQWYLYSAIFLVGFAYVLKHQINVRVDFWFANLTRKTKAWIDFVGHLISLIPFCLIGIWVSVPQAARSIRVGEMSPDASGLPRGPIKALLAAAFVLLLIQALAEQIKLYAVITGREHLVDIEEEPEQPIRVE
jgi:TRAP-type mannitol/chloroaromatic compound transport system permease small subunit